MWIRLSTLWGNNVEVEQRRLVDAQAMETGLLAFMKVFDEAVGEHVPADADARINKFGAVVGHLRVVQDTSTTRIDAVSSFIRVQQDAQAASMMQEAHSFLPDQATRDEHEATRQALAERARDSERNGTAPVGSGKDRIRSLIESSRTRRIHLPSERKKKEDTDEEEYKKEHKIDIHPEERLSRPAAKVSAKARTQRSEERTPLIAL